MSEPTLFDVLGGHSALRRVIWHFVDRMFDDVMIGFLFQAADRDRVKAKEYEFAARHLGAAVQYTGRPLGPVHQAHRISSGQFMRRLQILKETLAHFQVPPEVSQHFVQHTLALQSEITNGAPDHCGPAGAPHSSSESR